MATLQTTTDWRKEWYEIADATYLNTAAHAAIPRVALHAVETNRSQQVSASHRRRRFLRSSEPNSGIPRENDWGAKPEEIALTTGASTGVAAVANFPRWKPGDEVVTAKGNFHCNMPPGNPWKNAMV